MDSLREQHCLHLDIRQDTTRFLNQPILLLHGACFLDFPVNFVSLIGMIMDKKYNNLIFISNISLSPFYNYVSVYLIFIIVILEKRLYNLLPKMAHF